MAARRETEREDEGGQAVDGGFLSVDCPFVKVANDPNTQETRIHQERSANCYGTWEFKVLAISRGLAFW